MRFEKGRQLMIKDGKGECGFTNRPATLKHMIFRCIQKEKGGTYCGIDGI